MVTPQHRTSANVRWEKPVTRTAERTLEGNTMIKTWRDNHETKAHCADP